MNVFLEKVIQIFLQEEGAWVMKRDSEAGGKTAKQVEEERRREKEHRMAEKEKESKWPCSITSPLSLIIAASPKEPKQTKSGLMYFPVTTAWQEPNSCSQREISFWKTPLVNMPLCMADSSLGPPPLSSLLSFVLFHFPSVYFQGKERRHSVDVKNALLTQSQSFSLSHSLWSYN